MKSEHHPCGPSTLGRLMACPASLILSRDEPDVESDDAAEGTLLHKAVERCIVGDPGWFDGLSPEQVEDVETCLRFVEEVADVSIL
jgi:hypothetical protein